MDPNTDLDQREVIALLGEPSSYTPPPESVERIETHGAIVFLAGDRAYKIKRAVKLAYLNFSTLDKRRAACEREVEINRLTAPGIYLRAVAIARQSSGSLKIAGDGEVVEWAVEMIRFAQRDLLDRMAVEDRLPLALMAPLADHIAAYHENAPAGWTSDGVTGLTSVTASIVKALANAGDCLDAQTVSDYTGRLEAALCDAKALLSRRAAAGHVRRCHGDLHLRNIVLLDGNPTLFDAIEFDEELATVDILYDLAFLLMDLWHRGEKPHANAVLNRYLWRDGALANINGLAALPLFLSLRAGVRAMVTLDRLPHVGGDKAAAAKQELREYFSLGQSFLSPPAPRLVVIGGLSGTGKSTLAAALAPYLGAAPGAFHLRSDVERKILFGKQPEERLDQAAYAEEATARVYARLYRKAGLALAAGRCVILDAVFAGIEERKTAELVAQLEGIPFDGIWLTAPREKLLDRVDKRTGDASDADAQVVRAQLNYETGTIGWRMLDAGGEANRVAAAAATMLDIAINDNSGN